MSGSLFAFCKCGYHQLPCPHCTPQAFEKKESPSSHPAYCPSCNSAPCHCPFNMVYPPRPFYPPKPYTHSFSFGPSWQPQEPTKEREWSSPSPSTTTTTSQDSTPTTLPLPTKGYLLSFDQARGLVTLVRRTTSGEIDRRELSSTSQRFELLPLWVSLNELATCWMQA